MHAWAGIALALRGPGDDGMRSRLPTAAHPLAGRSVAWHVLRALAESEPPPAQLLLVTAQPADPSVVGELPAATVAAPPDGWWSAVAERLDPAIRRVLVVDAAAATLLRSIAALLDGPANRALGGDGTAPLAVWLDRSVAAERAGAGSIEHLAQGLESLPVAPQEAVVVRDRASLAQAVAIVRDRVVHRLMDGGVTFLLPETVLVDVDVRIGADTVIYPGVILEGNATIGAETVIGPGCRIIDSWIGSGVELKGWNYIVGASIRNRAVLEPYVRRGFD